MYNSKSIEIWILYCYFWLAGGWQGCLGSESASRSVARRNLPSGSRIWMSLTGRSSTNATLDSHSPHSYTHTRIKKTTATHMELRQFCRNVMAITYRRWNVERAATSSCLSSCTCSCSGSLFSICTTSVVLPSLSMSYTSGYSLTWPVLCW